VKTKNETTRLIDAIFADSSRARRATYGIATEKIYHTIVLHLYPLINQNISRSKPPFDTKSATDALSAKHAAAACAFRR